MAVARKTTGSNDNLARKTSKGTQRRNGTGKNAGRGKSGVGNASASRAKSGRQSAEMRRRNLDKMNEYRDHQVFETGITVAAMGIISLLLYLSFFSLAGNAGMVIGGLMFGIFGWFAWFLPIAVMTGYIFIQVNAGNQKLFRKTVGLVGMIFSLMALTDLIFNNDTIYEYYKINHVTHKGYFDAMFLACKNVMEWGKFNGGLLGRMFGSIFSVILGRVGATLILLALLFLFIYIFYGIEALAGIRKRNAYLQEMGEIYEQIKEDEEYREPSYRVFTFRENKNFGKKPMRELEKVPKVQSFDLMGQAEFFEGKKEQKIEKSKSDGRSVEDEQATLDTVSVELLDREEPEDIKKEGEASESNVFEHMISQHVTPEHTEPDSEHPEHENLERSETDHAALDPTEEKKEKIADIPIYRNELEAKFGRARNHQEVELVDVKNVFAVEKFEDRESAFERFAMKRKSEQQKQFEMGRGLSEVEAFSETEDPVKTEDYSEIEDPVETEDYSEIEDTVESEGFSKIEDPMESEGFSKIEDTVESEDFSEIEDPMEVEDFSEIEDQGRARDFFETKTEDDFIPQKPMSSFKPKEMITAESRASAKSGHPSVAENGSRVFADFSTLKEKRQSMDGKREEPKIEKPYEFPPVDLLGKLKSRSNSASDEELRSTALKLQETLESFNVKVKMGAVTCGPSVTRYELYPEQGVRVNKITNLADDLKLSLAAQSIRIEAPIPGKAAVGIEVPNAEASPVPFRELLEGQAFEESKSPLTFAVGKDIAGKLIMADIAKMPHLLIAGATGSGKSVCINTLIMSILYKADPKDVKLIMIDPKVVELSCYNGIPHLFCPVVTDPKEAAASLNWAVREMMDRYNKFKELNVRNIAGYNEKIRKIERAEEEGYVKMPYLVVIVDEFADLMMVASKEVEDAICRLAQLARAAGIHLVLATQRPSVNVITGVIKANIPSRIAFSVSSAIDSRTILDKGGAEKLLGKGDMLFFPSGYTEPVRVQGAFVSDQEVNDVVEFLRDTNDTPEYNHQVTEIVEEPQQEPAAEKKPQSDKDEYFADAGRFVIESERAAAGQLQRHFSIGFNRAGRIIDQLEKAGVVGPAAGTKPRAVLMTLEEFDQMLQGDPSGMDMMEEAL